MILELLALIGAYAAGASRDISTSIYVMALAGAVLFYVVIHVVFFTFTSEQDDVGIEFYYAEQVTVEKKRKRLLSLGNFVHGCDLPSRVDPSGRLLAPGRQ